MTDEQVYAGVEKALRKYFGKRGDRVVQDNLTCVKRGYSEMKEIPRVQHDSRRQLKGRRASLHDPISIPCDLVHPDPPQAEP